MQAKCFLDGEYLTPEGVYNFAKGKTIQGYSFFNDKPVWKTDYYWPGDGTKYVRNRTYDTISDALHARGFNFKNICLGDAHDGTSRFGSNTLYLVGSRDDVLKMLFDASVEPEIVLHPRVFMGVFHWPHTFGPDRIAVRLQASRHRPKAEVGGFRDFEVTSDVGCISGPGWTTVHAAAFYGPLKTFLDVNKIR